MERMAENLQIPDVVHDGPSQSSSTEQVKRSLGYRIGSTVDTVVRLVGEVNPLRYAMFVYKGIGGDAKEWEYYLESGKYNGKRGITGGKRYGRSTAAWYGSLDGTWESWWNHQGQFASPEDRKKWGYQDTFCVVAMRAFSRERNRLPIHSGDKGKNPQEHGRQIFRWRNVENVFVGRDYFERMKQIYRSIEKPSISWENLCRKIVLTDSHYDFDKKILRLRILRHVKSNLKPQDKDINLWMDSNTGIYHPYHPVPQSTEK